MKCVQVGGLTICRPNPFEEVARESAGIRWCFKCRSRTPYDDVLWRETGMSYYDPHWQRTCQVCGEDASCFPGTSLEWRE